MKSVGIDNCSLSHLCFIHVIVIKNVGEAVANQISEIEDFNFLSKIRSHRKQTFATCWAGKRAREKEWREERDIDSD